MAAQESKGSTATICGRIVWTSGDLFKGRQKFDSRTKQPKLGRDGKPLMEYGFGLAVAKTDITQGQQGWALYEAMYKEAFQIYPSGQLPPGFAMKMKDGDGVDHNGQPMGSRPGHAGHQIFAMTTMLPIKFFRHVNGAYTLLEGGVKCGDFVQVQVQVKAHGPVENGKPGLYLNPVGVVWCYEGEEIVNTPSPEMMFGAAPAAGWMPPGASPLPPSGMPSFGGAPAPVAPQGFPQPGFGGAAPATPSMPQQAAPQVTPNYGVLPQQFQPQAAPAGFAQTLAPVAPQGFPQPGFGGAAPATPSMPAIQQPTGMPGIPQIPGV